MNEPNPEFYENDDATLIGPANKVALGGVTRGTVAEPTGAGKKPVHLWNDKGGGTLKAMELVRVGVKDLSGGDAGEFIAGTALNGSQPFYECRSYGASGCPDDGQGSFVPIGGTTWRAIGDIPANARRSLHVRCSVPADATVGAGQISGRLVGA